MSITTIVISLIACFVTYAVLDIMVGFMMESAEEAFKFAGEDIKQLGWLDRALVRYSGWKNEMTKLKYEGIEVVARPLYSKADALEDFVTAVVSIGIVLAVALAIDSPKVGVGEAKIYPVQEIHDAAESQGVRTPEDGR